MVSETVNNLSYEEEFPLITFHGNQKEKYKNKSKNVASTNSGVKEMGSHQLTKNEVKKEVKIRKRYCIDKRFRCLNFINFMGPFNSKYICK